MALAANSRPSSAFSMQLTEMPPAHQFQLGQDAGSQRVQLVTNLCKLGQKLSKAPLRHVSLNAGRILLNAKSDLASCKRLAFLPSGAAFQFFKGQRFADRLLPWTLLADSCCYPGQILTKDQGELSIATCNCILTDSNSSESSRALCPAF